MPAKRPPTKGDLWERDALLALADLAAEEAEDAEQQSILLSRQAERQSAHAELLRVQADRLAAGPASGDRPLGKLLVFPFDNTTNGD